MPRTSAAEWVRSHYGVPAQTHRRIAYTGDHAKGRQLGEIVGFSGGHLRIRLDGERRILTTHPTWEMEYLPEVTNEQCCEQCGRVGTRGFRTLKADCPGIPEITVCTSGSACRKRWPRPARIDE